MEEFNNKGELHGFDSDESNKNNGYTVTPDGSYYDSNNNYRESKETGDNEPVPVKFNTDGNYSSGSYKPQNNDFMFRQNNKPINHNKREKGFGFGTLIASVLIAAIVGASFGVGFFALTNGHFKTENSAVSSNTEQNNYNINVQNVDATIVEAAAVKATPSVVGIRTTVSVNNFFFGQQESSGEGSGVIYSSDGYIITNYHVIQQAVESGGNDSKIKVFLTSEDEEGHDASVVGYNISHDLAVIKIGVKNLTPIKFADSANLNVGQFVVAVGNPGGLQFMGSVTYGVISGLNRVLSDAGSTSSVELIQTDAAINPGNSGGALVNIQGELIGINSSKLVSESVEGMGFAIPSNTTKDICDKIISKEYDPSPYLGITISERYDAETLKEYNFPVGAVVYSVVSGSPAAEVGIKSGDIITEFNGVEITNYTVLSEALAECKPEQTVSMKVYRAGNSYEIKIKIGSNNSQ